MGKTKSKKNYENNKKIKRSCYTGRIVNGRDVILSDEAEEYLKKQGYKVIKPQLIACVHTFTYLLIILGGYLIWT